MKSKNESNKKISNQNLNSIKTNLKDNAMINQLYSFPSSPKFKKSNTRGKVTFSNANKDDNSNKLDFLKLANQVRRLSHFHKITLKKRQQRLKKLDPKSIRDVDPNMIIEEEEEEKKVDSTKQIEFFKIEP